MENQVTNMSQMLLGKVTASAEGAQAMASTTQKWNCTDPQSTVDFNLSKDGVKKHCNKNIEEQIPNLQDERTKRC